MEYCSGDELVLRAIQKTHYDGNRLTSKIWKTSKPASVSRLCVFDYPKLIQIFKRDVREFTGNVLQVQISTLQETAASFEPSPTVLNVAICEEPENLAHAQVETDRPISAGLARKLKKCSAELRGETQSND